MKKYILVWPLLDYECKTTTNDNIYTFIVEVIEVWKI
jgi:hypothetical protein